MNETYFEQLLQWLARCPALTGIDLRVDDLPPAVALRKESVDRNNAVNKVLDKVAPSLSARRAWIEIGRCR